MSGRKAKMRGEMRGKRKHCDYSRTKFAKQDVEDATNYYLEELQKRLGKPIIIGVDHAREPSIAVYFRGSKK